MFANMNAHLVRHHEIDISVIKQLNQGAAHLGQWAQHAETDIKGNYSSPCGGKEGQACLDTLVDAVRRVLVLDSENGHPLRNKDELARREALYNALHAYFGVSVEGVD